MGRYGRLKNDHPSIASKGYCADVHRGAIRYARPMRRLWLLVAFALLIFIDLSVLPAVVLGLIAGSILAAGSHRASSLPAIAIAVVLGTMLIGLTLLVGRAWRRAPRPSRSN